ncbi:hypothetical protein HOO65_050651 [Ceratocystis lukuohia]|uniref:MICOS complex subunit MIC12 n=3 Tax=Ceratocystis TaxID=5157 RepID=A0A0F8B820_CERFI|nr:hypothetical protein CFO_g570 [Ceratocystis platani]PHH49501.1 hypothetical protein CFIMG_006921RA [Ceratocystis fimbriata CBS 114723]
MGFNSGFAGGVTVTLGLVYFSLLTHQRNREYQSLILRSHNAQLASSLDPAPGLAPPSRAEIEAAARANIVDASKDRWNRELQNAVRSVQNTDWDEVRERMEISAQQLWARMTGSRV